MKSAKTWRNSLLCLVAFALGGCSLTVTPALNRPASASYSGAARNSGVLATAKGGFVVDAATRDRYNALIARFGKGVAEYPFLPPLPSDFGITTRPDGTFLLSPEAEVRFALMNRWAHSGKAGL